MCTADTLVKNKMAQTSKLKNPRRKKGAKLHPKDAPFPVPVESITKKECCDSRWFYYTGYFRDNCVVIENHGDLTFLYKMVSKNVLFSAFAVLPPFATPNSPTFMHRFNGQAKSIQLSLQGVHLHAPYQLPYASLFVLTVAVNRCMEAELNGE